MGYHFSVAKALNLYANSCNHITTPPKNSNTKILLTTATKRLTSFKCQVAELEAQFISLAKQLPEYDTVIGMYNVGENSAAQLMAEIGNVRRFHNRNALVGFAGVDPIVDESGKDVSKCHPTTKRGLAHLIRTLFQVLSTYVKRSPADEPVYQFIVKKRSEGKPYYVYMTAAANKFLRIYYARVKECMAD